MTTCVLIDCPGCAGRGCKLCRHTGAVPAEALEPGVTDADVDRLLDEMDDDGEITCGYCNGSGEGAYDGSRCHACHGRGWFLKGGR